MSEPVISVVVVSDYVRADHLAERAGATRDDDRPVVK